MRYFIIFASISISLALANNNGKTCKTEFFYLSYSKNSTLGLDVIESVFDFCDGKGTGEGLLTLAEVEEYQCMDFLRTALGILDKNIARDFEAIDENGDGLVSKQESFKALQALDIDRSYMPIGGGTVTEVNHCEIEEIETAMFSKQLKKMLVSTGSPIDTVVASEVIDLTDASNVCEPLGDFQATQGVGGVFGDTGETSGFFSTCKRYLCAPSPLICAAHWTSTWDWENRCFVAGGSDEVVAMLQTERRFAASVKYDDKTLWATGTFLEKEVCPTHPFIEITGGLTDGSFFDEPLATTEFLTVDGGSPDQSNYGPELPVALWGHCIVAIDDNSFIVAGGVTGFFGISKSTYIYNKLTEEWTEGPQMTTERSHLQCASFKSDAHGNGYHNVVVAVGGYSDHNTILDTAEIYDPWNSAAGWVQSMVS